MNTETATETVETTTERRAAVGDKPIMRAMLAASVTGEDGRTVGTLDSVAEELGMNKGSLNGRLTQMRKMGIPIPKLSRSANKEGSKTRAKSADAMMELFNEISEDLGIEIDTDDDGEYTDAE